MVITESMARDMFRHRLMQMDKWGRFYVSDVWAAFKIIGIDLVEHRDVWNFLTPFSTLKYEEIPAELQKQMMYEVENLAGFTVFR